MILNKNEIHLLYYGYDYTIIKFNYYLCCSTPLPPLPTDKPVIHGNEEYCNTIGYGHLAAQDDDIYSKPMVYIFC